MTDFFISLAYFQKNIKKSLENFLAHKQKDISKIDQNLLTYQEILSQLMLFGGKNLRGFLAERLYLLFGGKEKIVSVAMALEFLQAFALIHDDIIDKSKLRRNILTAHYFLQEKYKPSLGQKRATDFGNSQAILLGDLALVYANELFATQNNNTQKAKIFWFEMLNEVILGQQLDVELSFLHNFDFKRQELIMLYKSGLYSIARPMMLGCALAKANTKDLAVIKEIGSFLGIAFQIKDDLFSITSKQKKLGKPNLTDFLEKKITLPLLIAFKKNQKIIQEYLQLKTVSLQKAQNIQKFLSSPQIVFETEKKLSDIIKKANQAIDNSHLTSKQKLFLTELAKYLLERDF